MELLGIKTFKWPGYNLKDDQPYQFVEKEYMLADEYDDLLKDPTGYTLHKLLPRMSEIFQPLEFLPDLKLLGCGYTIIQAVPMLAGLEPFVELMDKLKETGQEYLTYNEIRIRLKEELKEMGFPVLTEAIGLCAFDWISDNLRGLKGTIMDMFRQPDKLKEAIKIFEPMCIEAILLATSRADRKRVYIPLHRGAAGFMSDEQFAEFYWPQLKNLLLTLVEAGLTPMPFFEGDYTPRLKYLAELPPGKVLGHFDKVDRKKCKEILGDVICFWGNIPASLLCAGSPEEVKDDVKSLIDTFADNGGLIIDASTPGPPAEAKPENVEAMTATVFEYGKN
jgi:uroporphyrinogen-III decarboxylase